MAVLTGAEIKRRILSDGLIANYDNLDLQIQPNGIDLRVQDIAYIDSGRGRLSVDNAQRLLPSTRDLAWSNAVDTARLPVVRLHEGVYLVRLMETVNLPADLMARTLPRSSLLRMGASIESAVWDAGYCGAGQVQLVVNSPGIIVEQGARIVQMVFEELTSTSQHLYSGVYQGEGRTPRQRAPSMPKRLTQQMLPIPTILRTDEVRLIPPSVLHEVAETFHAEGGSANEGSE